MVNDGQINPMAVFKSPRAGQFGAPDAVPARESSDDVHGLQKVRRDLMAEFQTWVASESHQLLYNPNL